MAAYLRQGGGDLVIHHFGVDNIYIRSDFTGGTNPYPTSKNLILDRVVCEYSGRAGFSWVGGENICVINSTFNHASNKTIKTKPGYGMDIEPEGKKWEVLCRDGFFNNSVFGYNKGLSLVAGTSLDNPLPPSINNGYGYSYGHYFSKCLLIGSLNSTTHNYINRVTFDSCKFYGQVLNYGSSISLNQSPSVYKNSYFSDCYNGRQMFQSPLLSMELSYRAQFINNVYKRFFSNGIDSWIFHYGTSFYDCDSSFYKPLFQNNIFYFYPAPTGSLQYSSNSRRSLFVNNNFYKYNTDLIRWGISMGCQQGQEGNEEPNGTGTGVIQNYITASPQCADTLVCERDIYTSNIITNSEFYRATSFIYTDSKIDLSNNTDNVKYQSAESINMNPGFESNLNGSAAYIDLYIAPCTLPSGRTTNEAAPKPKMSDFEQINKDQYLIVYPNPSKNEFLVQFKAGNNSRIEYWITDIQGRVIERKYIDVQKIPSSYFSIKAIKIPGVYLLTLNFGDKNEIRKLLRL
ncbi:MAG TPA: T9SS type A sorting domain-containing protein [Ferruginibacter sp.]|nr:T9SS type A sorting domain-containing protein [Ferruginibacter sp.]